MRTSLEGVWRSEGPPDHLGLAYEVWAPSGATDGKVPDAGRADWLSNVALISIATDYRHAFARWEASFTGNEGRAFRLKATSRLLIGHGNASAVDVGLTVHRTWGVPMIPGSSVKGLLAHYVDSTYGPNDPNLAPWEQTDAERVRAEYQGVAGPEDRDRRGPGRIYRGLFGAPNTPSDEDMTERGFPAGAAAGRVCFYDALYIPGSLANDRPFAPDVLTVHQKAYYDNAGGTWPNDYDSPTPVAFLTVRPGAQFLFALSGPSAWVELAARLLQDALAAWGIGGKTSAGYGRFGDPSQAQAAADGRHPDVRGSRPAGGGRPPKTGDLVEVVLLEERTKKGGWRALHEPTGLSGPIQNSAAVPETEQPGNRIHVEVAHANPRDIAFKVPSEANSGGTKGKGR